jgi:hypothetical protein
MSPATPLTVVSATPYGFTVAVAGPTASSVSVSYEGLPANTPKTNNNFVAIWAASMIPWTKAPMKQQPVDLDNEDGALTLTGISIGATTYVVGYGVGPDVTSICASAVFSLAALAAGPPSSVSIGVASITTESLAVRYRTLAGYLPQKYGNWIGLWPGYASPYNPSEPLAKALIGSSASEGTALFNNLSISADSDYTLIYFMGLDDYNTAAAMLYFSTGA